VINKHTEINLRVAKQHLQYIPCRWYVVLMFAVAYDLYNSPDEDEAFTAQYSSIADNGVNTVPNEKEVLFVVCV